MDIGGAGGRPPIQSGALVSPEFVFVRVAESLWVETPYVQVVDPTIRTLTLSHYRKRDARWILVAMVDVL